MKPITINSVKKNGWLIFEAITGSKAYGLDGEKSDTDIRGVFILPKEEFYSLEYTAQVSNDSNDIVYYELKRFVELLSKNNPNIMEMLGLPEKCILYKHPVMETIRLEDMLSKLCEQTFANYAYSQIKKAAGLEKKIMQPMSEKRKTIFEFCYVHQQKTVLALTDFLAVNKLQQEDIGLSSINHLKDCYNMFHNVPGIYNGIVKKETANDVSLSSIDKKAMPIGLLYFNKDGYSMHCKAYQEYWDWVAKRNEDRYNSTMAHGKKYDSKNMMHVFRLLQMAKEIALEGKINVHRTNRKWLLDIKEGKFEYHELVEKATLLKDELPALYQQSTLMDKPDIKKIEQVLINMRKSYYCE